MKKMFALVLALLMFVVPSVAEVYPNIAEIVSVENGITLMEDFDGYLWEMENDDFEAGSVLLLVMDDMGTESIEDDEIVNVRLFSVG